MDMELMTSDASMEMELEAPAGGEEMSFDVPAMGNGAQADWNAKEGEPGHVLNRTHWKNEKFETIVANNSSTSGADRVDASAIGMGEFVKISEQVIPWENLNGAKIDCRNANSSGTTYIEGFPLEETGGLAVGSYAASDDLGTDVLYGYVASFPAAMDLPEYGINIPSAGTYIHTDLIDTWRTWGVSIENVEIQQIGNEYVPHIKPYDWRTGLILSADGTEQGKAIDDAILEHIINNRTVLIRFYWKNTYVPCDCVVSFSKAYDASNHCAYSIMTIGLETIMLALEIRGNVLYAKATPFAPEEYQTAEQVKTIIKEAIANIPIYNGEVSE